MNDKLIAIGAYHETVNGSSYAGRTYVFNTKGSLVRTFTSPNAQYFGDFGSSLAISSSILAIGAPGESASGISFSGRAYVFHFNGSLTETLQSTHPQHKAFFGSAVAITNSQVLVTAPHESARGLSQAGRVYVFNFE